MFVRSLGTVGLLTPKSSLRCAMRTLPRVAISLAMRSWRSSGKLGPRQGQSRLACPRSGYRRGFRKKTKASKVHAVDDKPVGSFLAPRQRSLANRLCAAGGADLTS
jgi:hypothetical protein